MAKPDDVMQVHIFVSGLVQGVGFRYFVQRTAVSLNVCGWTRNLWDGRVEIVAEGRRAALEQLVAAVRRGPSAAHVTNVQLEWGAASGVFEDFRVRSDA